MALDPKARFIIGAEDRTRAAFASVDKNLKGIGSVASRTSQLLTAALGGTAIAAASRSIISTQVSIERINTTLKVATGSAEAAAEAYSYVSNRARELGLNFEATAGSFARFTAAARGTALEGAKSREIFDSVAVAARVLSLSASDTEGVLRALEQMISKGNVQAEELRGQLGERLPGAFQMAAKAMGVTTEELNDMLKSGKVAADDLLPKLAVELRKTFGPEAQNAAKTLGAQMERLNFQWENLKASIVSVGSSQTGVGWLESFLGGIAVLFGNALDPADALELKIRDVEEQIKRLGTDVRLSGSTKGKLAELKKEYDELLKQQQKLFGLGEFSPKSTPKEPESGTPSVSTGLPDHIIAAGEAATRRFNTMREFEQNAKDLEFAAKMMDDRAKGMRDARDDLMGVLGSGIDRGVRETADLASDSIEQVASAMEDAIDRTNELSVFAEQAARNMQSHFADFLFDPFDDGLKGMAKGFLDTIRRMMAEAAAAKIFETLFGEKKSGGSSTGGILSSFFGSLIGARADGGPVFGGRPYIVGERGPELFMPGASGSIVPNHALAKSQPQIVYSPVYNIQSGVTRRELMPALEATRKQSVADMSRLIKGGAFA